MDKMVTLKTSEDGWFTALHQCYNNNVPFFLIDDAKFGINPGSETLAQMGLKANLTGDEWMRASACLGVGALGVGIIMMAVRDPEPTSQLALLVSGGLAVALLGGLGALWILLRVRPATIRVFNGGFNGTWDKPNGASA